MPEPLVAAVERHLTALVERHPDRHPGRPGNVAANDYAESVMVERGWAVESVAFDIVDAELGPARLRVGDRSFEIHPGPYTLPVAASAPLLPIASLSTLEDANIDGAIVLLHGPIAAEQLFPKSFDFVDAPEHRRIYELLEGSAAVAVIGATGRGGGMSGALYPSPLIEDGEFGLPTAYTTDEIGDQLVARAGESAHLEIVARRVTLPSRQLFARRGPAGAPRAVVMAHIDSKGGSPGAIDNATGVAALLATAQLLSDYDGPYRLELIPMNGEDYFGSSGEHLFVAANEGRWEELLGVVNMDAIGARGSRTAASMYSVGKRGTELIGRVVRRHPTVSLGEQWWESDHSIVVAHGRPTVALTSTSFRELCATVTHTEHDTLDRVDPSLVAAAAEFVADLMRSLPAVGGTGA